MNFLIMNLSRCLSAYLLLCLPLGAQVNLGGEIVPKDSVIVFLAIGHSNMAGRAQADLNTHPRAWNYRIGPGNNGWEPAKDPLHGHQDNNNCSITNRGSMSFQFLKRIAEEYPCYHFGMIMNANSKATIHWDAKGSTCRPSCANRFYGKGGCLYEELIAAAKELKGKVTFGGVIAQIGFIESRESLQHAKSFGEDVAQTIRDMRSDLDEPGLPLLIGRYEEHASDIVSHRRHVIDGIRAIPSMLSYSAVIESDGPYVDGHHYNAEGHRRWADSAAVLHRRKGWLRCDPVIDNEPPSRPTGLALDAYNAATARIHWNASSDNVGITEYRVYNGATMLRAVDGTVTSTTLSGLTPETGYVLTIMAVDAAGNVSPASNTKSFQTGSVKFARVPLKINAGGSDRDGFDADQVWVEGEGWGHYELPGASQPSTTTCVNEPIYATSLDEIFRCVRYRDFGYRFRLDNGAYTLSLHFTELWRNEPNRRPFSIKVQNKLLPDMPFDIYAESGGRGQAYTIRHEAVVGDEMLDITFLRTDNETPLVSAIELEKAIVYTIASPNGNEQFTAGDNITIEWSTNTSITDEAMIDFSVDGGTNWHAVNDATLHTSDTDWQKYRWTIPAKADSKPISSDECVIRVRDYEAYFVDYSDEFFSITPGDTPVLATITNTRPAKLKIAGLTFDTGALDEIEAIEIVNMNGKLIFKAKVLNQQRFSGLKLSNGIYLLKLIASTSVQSRIFTVVDK
ncbi:MAG: T9SS type A sorting domain-containing protein [Chitinivibrionales bacterium]|nr:T9SS type A sorting domain-containing protein [Chitinivibrionales bacterium]